MEHEGDGDTNCNRCTWNDPQMLSQKAGRVRNLRHCWGRPEYWEKSRKPEETCCLSDPSEWPLANAGVKNSQGIIIIIKHWQLAIR